MKKLNLATQILIALILGALAGFIFKEKVVIIKPLGTIFLRLLKMTILPLVFFSIVAGVSGIADLQRLKKVGVTFLGYWALASALAGIMGIVWAFIIRPGQNITLPVTEKPDVNVNLLDSVINWIPDNVAAAFSGGNLLQVIVFALFVGITISLISNTKGGKMLADLFEAGSDMMSRMVGIVLRFAPIGVFALISNVTGTLGAIVLKGIGKMILTQYIAYGMMLIIVYPIILKFIAKVNPIQHFKNIYPAMVLAFSTQSSSATLPLTMESTKKRAGVPEDMVNLIAPPAATINMHACAAEMPIYAVFASQIYGINLGFTDLITIVILGVIMAAGVAGVPGGGIMMSAVLLQVMGLPLDIVPWIAGVYILIDMPNTMLNVTGDTVGMVYTAAKLGELDKEVFNAPK
ncbi:C4-dicarboxylate transport protein [Koleobacter methoxysyntrophicus]|uniref:C4-dicarboxylate transport protein n=1 Tax=Koleobacter methoxysyntrophicus TaxID=2751313 RepID=A0A8A0RKX4_9FIRM|nr:dicarboxylate/amino acid:cation symporter [Koleobacter methoxysyntrophicus]QSQ09035.1 C4-dicarboxylate transport protein [Koleobacter methoxysyntrophicus]